MGQSATEHMNAPLGVLLDLVERGKLEVTQLSIGKIAIEYLAQIDRLKDRGVEELSDFIQLGARLIYMKSQALLPSVPEQVAEITKLTTELADYRQTRQAATALANLPLHFTFEKPARPAKGLQLPQNNPTNHATSNPAVLVQALQAVQLRQAQVWPSASTQAAKLSLKQAMSSVMEQANTAPLNLLELVSRAASKTEAVVWILACLELVKAGSLSYTPIGPNNYRLEVHHG